MVGNRPLVTFGTNKFLLGPTNSLMKKLNINHGEFKAKDPKKLL